MSSLLVVVSNLVEVILVELPDEARKVAVFEMLWQYGLGEPLVLVPSQLGSVYWTIALPWL